MKYIIESNDVIGYTPKYAMLFGDGYMIQPLEDLEELNSDYINEHFGWLQDDAYQRGLDDGWEAVRKIFGSTTDGGYSMAQIREILGKRSLFCAPDVIRQCTINEVIEKLKSYEEKQKTEDDIKVGDEVDWNGDLFIVTYIAFDGLCGVAEDGATYDAVLPKNVKKTGRHFDIADMLKGIFGGTDADMLD